MNLISRFFKKEEKIVYDYSLLQTDIHSHFIPGIDDGAKTIEDSLTLLRSMAELGYKKVITTPHIMGDNYKNTPEIILSGLEKVRKAVMENQIPITVDAAAEYYLDYDFENKIEHEQLLTFGNKYLLFEVSYLNPPERLNEAIFKLQMGGYKPVLAHPERYPFWYNNFEKYEELKDKGVLFQMNINSLTGHYSPATRKIAQQLIDKNMVDLIGSDCHHTGHIQLLKQCLKEKYLQKLLGSGKLLNSRI